MLSKNKERQLIKLYPTTSNLDIAKILKVPIWAVVKRAEELGLEKEDSSWSDRDMNILSEIYADSSNDDISRIIGKNKMQIEHQAYRMGMLKNKNYFVNINNTQQETDLVRQWSEEYNYKIHGNSRGNYVLEKILEAMFPNYRIFPEYTVGNLKIDVYIQELKIALEYHGIQHGEFSQFFHGDKFKFREAQDRDWKKSEFCEALGIGLIVFWHDENLSFGLVRAKIGEVI